MIPWQTLPYTGMAEEPLSLKAQGSLSNRKGIIEMSSEQLENYVERASPLPTQEKAPQPSYVLSANCQCPSRIGLLSRRTMHKNDSLLPFKRTSYLYFEGLHNNDDDDDTRYWFLHWLSNAQNLSLRSSIVNK